MTLGVSVGVDVTLEVGVDVTLGVSVGVNVTLGVPVGDGVILGVGVGVGQDAGYTKYVSPPPIPPVNDNTPFCGNLPESKVKKLNSPIAVSPDAVVPEFKGFVTPCSLTDQPKSVEPENALAKIETAPPPKFAENTE